MSLKAGGEGLNLQEAQTVYVNRLFRGVNRVVEAETRECAKGGRGEGGKRAE